MERSSYFDPGNQFDLLRGRLGRLIRRKLVSRESRWRSIDVSFRDSLVEISRARERERNTSSFDYFERETSVWPGSSVDFYRRLRERIVFCCVDLNFPVFYLLLRSELALNELCIFETKHSSSIMCAQPCPVFSRVFECRDRYDWEISHNFFVLRSAPLKRDATGEITRRVVQSDIVWTICTNPPCGFRVQVLTSCRADCQREAESCKGFPLNFRMNGRRSERHRFQDYSINALILWFEF